MKIVSDFHDYYDCISRGSAQDDFRFVRSSQEVSLTFVRGAEKDAFKKALSETPVYASAYFHRLGHVTCTGIFFCGKIYYHYDFSVQIPDKKNFYSEGAFSSCSIYSPDEIPKIVEKLKELEADKRDVLQVEDELNSAFGLKKPKFSFMFQKPFPREQIEKELYGYAIKNNVAYFKIEKESHGNLRLTHYPNLMKESFFKVMDTNQAYQEIERFLLNDLAKERMMPINPISDKLKAETHGFDRFSFRKDKAKN